MFFLAVVGPAIGALVIGFFGFLLATRIAGCISNK